MPRTHDLFNPTDDRPYPLGLNRIERFLDCRRCFYLDRRHGVAQPSGAPLRLNAAVDALLRREFDGYRARGEAHPYMREAGIDAVPARHSQLGEWRRHAIGVRVLHEPTKLIVSSAIDDLWVGGDGRYLVIDYRATASNGEAGVNAARQAVCRRRIELHQWLLRRNGLDVSDTAWSVHCNGRLDRPGFEGRIDFRVKVVPFEGDAGWVERAIIAAHETLISSALPPASPGCDLCRYRAAARLAEDASRSVSSGNRTPPSRGQIP
jgi:hypothetical protein